MSSRQHSTTQSPFASTRTQFPPHCLPPQSPSFKIHFLSSYSGKVAFVTCEHREVQPIVIVQKHLLSTVIHSFYLNTLKMQTDPLKSEKVGGEVKVTHISLIAVSS